MKKISSILFVFALIIAGFGYHMIPAYAEVGDQAKQSLTPEQVSAFQATLNAAKIKLLELQSQVANGTVPQPSIEAATLSAGDVGAIRNALTALSNALIALRANLEAHPDTYIPSKQGALGHTLSGMSKTLGTIAQIALASSKTSGSGPIAMHTMPRVARVSSAPVQPNIQTNNAAPTEGKGNMDLLQKQNAKSVPADASKNLAQTSSAFSGWNWQWIGIVIIVAIIIEEIVRRRRKSSHS